MISPGRAGAESKSVPAREHRKMGKANDILLRYPYVREHKGDAAQWHLASKNPDASVDP